MTDRAARAWPVRASSFEGGHKLCRNRQAVEANGSKYAREYAKSSQNILPGAILIAVHMLHSMHVGRTFQHIFSSHHSVLFGPD